MVDDKIGQTGIGDTGFSKYDADNAPVIKNGGNDAIQDHVTTEQSMGSVYGGDNRSIGKAKGA